MFPYIATSGSSALVIFRVSFITINSNVTNSDDIFDFVETLVSN